MINEDFIITDNFSRKTSASWKPISVSNSNSMGGRPCPFIIATKALHYITCKLQFNQHFPICQQPRTKKYEGKLIKYWKVGEGWLNLPHPFLGIYLLYFLAVTRDDRSAMLSGVFSNKYRHLDANPELGSRYRDLASVKLILKIV